MITTKKIKNYVIIVLFVISGLIALWNEFGSTSEVSQPLSEDLNIVSSENTSAVDTLGEVDTSNNVEISDTINTSNNQEDYNNALASIDGYSDVIGVVRLDELDQAIKASYTKYAGDGWNGLVDGQTSGTKAGGRWGNYDDQLPEYDENNNEITYKEFDVNNKIDGQSRDAERFVVGSDDSVYYTSDHYDSYVKVIE